MPSNLSPDDSYDNRQYKIVDKDGKVHIVNAGSQSKAREWASQNNIVVVTITVLSPGTSRLLNKRFFWQ